MSSITRPTAPPPLRLLERPVLRSPLPPAAPAPARTPLAPLARLAHWWRSAG